MSVTLRIALIVGSLISLGIVAHGVRKAHIQIADSIFWVLSATTLFILALLPQIAYVCSSLLGFLSPSNFAFVTVIFLLLIKLFNLSCSVSKLSRKIDQLAEEHALNNVSHND